MATLYIREYRDVGRDSNGLLINCGREPAITDQTVAIGGASTASNAFDPQTRFVRLSTDAICSVVFGTAPTATTSNGRMPKDTIEFFAVLPGLSLKVAVISNT